MKPYGLLTYVNVSLPSEKDHKYNTRIREGCGCPNCNYNKRFPPRRFKTNRTTVKNMMRSLKKKQRQLNKQIIKQQFINE